MRLLSLKFTSSMVVPWSWRQSHAQPRSRFRSVLSSRESRETRRCSMVKHLLSWLMSTRSDSLPGLCVQALAAVRSLPPWSRMASVTVVPAVQLAAGREAHVWVRLSWRKTNGEALWELSAQGLVYSGGYIGLLPASTNTPRGLVWDHSELVPLQHSPETRHPCRHLESLQSCTLSPQLSEQGLLQLLCQPEICVGCGTEMAPLLC